MNINGSEVMEEITVTQLEDDMPAEVIKVKSTEEVKVIPINLKEEPVKLTFEEFQQTEEFKVLVDKLAKKHNTSPEKIIGRIAKTVLGTIGDTGVTAVNTVESTVNNVVDFGALLLKGANKTVCDLSRGVIRTATLNQTTKK